MKDIKLKEFKARGLRGFKNELVLDLNEKSIVLYGDNGTGKSSIADMIEWFYNNKVKHLSDNEVGRNGIDAMRHTSLDDNDDGVLSLKFKNTAFDCEKKLFIKKGAVNSESSNCTDIFNEYISSSASEKLLIRYKELSDFIIASPDQRLIQLSTIIGFSEVTETKRLLNRIYNKLDKDIKNSSFESIIQNSQRTLISNLGQNIVSIEQFIEAINNLLQNYKHQIKIIAIEDIPGVINNLKTPVDENKLLMISFFDNLKNALLSIKPVLNTLADDYKKFAKKYNELIDDAENLNNLKLTDLLSSGQKILMVNTDKIEECPLCLSSIEGKLLLEQIQKRLQSLNDIKIKKSNLEIIKQEVKQKADDERQKLRSLIGNHFFKDETFSNVKNNVIKICVDLKLVCDEIDKADFNKKINSEVQLSSVDIFTQFEEAIGKILEAIKATLPKNSDTELIVKLQECYNAYKEVIKQTELKKAIEVQRDTFEILCDVFAKKQKNALDLFFTEFSKNINDYYIFMNPDESVENIKLVPIESDDEIKGLTIEYEFYNNAVSPPHKYLSESHLNCLGLSFFLASVEAFNKVNKFFILDDVISSFDSNHRKRFLDLLAEKFNQYQIILLTHEKHFFEYARTVAKSKNWLVDTFRYSKENGVYLSETKKSLYDRIIKKFEDGNEEKLGHDIRVYLEHFSKDVANCIQAKVSFRYNDVNEERMAPELVNEIKSKINKSSKSDAGLSPLINPVLSRTLLSNFIGNKDSHDNDFDPSMGDCKAFWKDVLEIETAFKCGHCDTIINIKYYSTDSKEIKCRCGRLKYSWQE
jgi:recombinational DNA repair ATPase RecF